MEVAEEVAVAVVAEVKAEAIRKVFVVHDVHTIVTALQARRMHFHFS